MRKKNRNFNNTKSRLVSWGGCGKISSLLLVFLALLAINPIARSSVFAEEGTENTDWNNVNNPEDVVVDGIELYATSTNSIMSISFSPVAGVATTLGDIPTKFQVTATVNVQNSGGYTIYFGSNNQNLTRTGGTETIAPISGNVEFNSLENNTWGYAVQEGNTVADSATYTAVPGSVRGRTIYTNNSTNILNDSKTYTLSFAARIGTDKPAGTYTNQVTMSVVSSPMEVIEIAADFGIGTMQEMTSSVCSNAKDNDSDGKISGQLMDARDGKYYWVSKLTDGHCWMTQNLDLDIKTAAGAINTDDVTPPEGVWPDASLSDYDATPTITVYATSTMATPNTISADATSMYSWSLGSVNGKSDVYIIAPTTSSNCSIASNGNTYPTNGAYICPRQFTNYGAAPTTANNDERAHYLLGNHYQWSTATAGTGEGLTNGKQASGSLCPKGWKLPTGAAYGEFSSLIGSNDIGAITSSPYYFVRGGWIWPSINVLLYGAGSEGEYWSSTVYANDGKNAYSHGFSGTSYVVPNGNDPRSYGSFVRCVAR